MLGLTQQKSSALLSPRLKTSGLAIVLRVDDESRVESDVRYRPCGKRIFDEIRHRLY